MIQFQDFSFSYKKEIAVLDKINYSFKKGEITFLKGKSGVGKSTLIYSICGIIPEVIKGEYKGKVYVDDWVIGEIPLSNLSQKIGLMIQAPELQLAFPIVEQELAFSLENFCLKPSQIKRKISEVTKQFGIENLLKEKTNNLSFGQKKMVNFAALVIQSPDYFLLDEPFSGLSLNLKKKFAEIIVTLAEYENKGFIIVSHEEVKIPTSREIILC
jgi:energy-coupling factor transporter ATP-binding protein EcfA2